MTITVELSPRTQERLEALASIRGKRLETFVSDLIEQTVEERSFDEILAPFREGFATSGMTEEEATDLLDNTLKSVRTARLQAQQAQQ